MNIERLEQELQRIVDHLDQSTFLFEMLKAYEVPQAAITRLQKGDYNLSKNHAEVIWKKKLFFRHEDSADLHTLIDELAEDPKIAKHNPRFIIVTDFEELLALDTKTRDSLDIPLSKLPQNFDFFLPWAGMEKAQVQNENPADIKAAYKMGQLYDLIVADNPPKDDAARHALNIFLSRLLFCFFAEDTGIFKDGQFTNAIASHTQEDGSDLQAYLQKLFRVLNLEQKTDYPKYLQDFPYVNGGLFRDEYPVPKFDLKSKKLIIESGSLNWKAINPDIFGSMIQAVVHSDLRGNLGMHYTSIANIMKVIKPLFLDELYEEFEKAGDNKKKLEALLERMSKMRFFDPACGSGNFLIITFKELCLLEIKILQKLFSSIKGGRKNEQLGLSAVLSKIQLSQFYGIEIDDFAHETAKLSLWLAQHQMNLAFREVFGQARPTLPLQDGGNIVCGNATTLAWEEICPRTDQTYIVGNPPYLGSKVQGKSHKTEMNRVLGHFKSYKDLDYISCWFFLASKHIMGSASKFAFVTTNSISQGSQVAMLWPELLSLGIEIDFAYQSFKWTNSAKGNAGVTCAIIGMRFSSDKPKKLYSKGVLTLVKNINPYLMPGKNIYIARRAKPLADFPKMDLGNMPIDDGNLILSEREKIQLINKSSDSEYLLRELIGSSEFINGRIRWCLWISDSNRKDAEKVAEIKKRIDAVEAFRKSSKDAGTRKLAQRPHQFREMKEAKKTLMLVSRVSSERRHYIPIGFFDKNVKVADAQVVYDPLPFLFAVISSRMHMTWVRAVAGRLKTDYRYSSALCYNTFPFPEISEAQKTKLEDCVFKVLDEREKHSEKTMAQLYNPDKMPEGLRQAHHEMDLAIEQCYRKQPFTSDEERLEYLFKLYEEMIAAEQGRK